MRCDATPLNGVCGAIPEVEVGEDGGVGGGVEEEAVWGGEEGGWGGGGSALGEYMRRLGRKLSLWGSAGVRGSGNGR